MGKSGINGRKKEHRNKKTKFDLDNWDSTRKVSLVQSKVKEIEQRENKAMSYGKVLRHLEEAVTPMGIGMYKIFTHFMSAYGKEAKETNDCFVDITHIIAHTETEFDTLKKALIHRWSVKRGQDKINNLILGKYEDIAKAHSMERYYFIRTKEIKELMKGDIVLSNGTIKYRNENK